MAYTYRIGWSKLNKHYYGVRYSKRSKPSDLWNTYFTSSKIVKNFRKKYGEPDIVEIRKIFSEPRHAILWESKVLYKLKVRKNRNWLNICQNPMAIYKTNKILSLEEKLLIKTHLHKYAKRPRTPEWNRNVAKSKMKKCTDGIKIYNSINDLAKAYGLKHSGAKHRIISTTYNWSFI